MNTLNTLVNLSGLLIALIPVVCFALAAISAVIQNETSGSIAYHMAGVDAMSALDTFGPDDLAMLDTWIPSSALQALAGDTVDPMIGASLSFRSVL